jgi:hypothetical protein
MRFETVEAANAAVQKLDGVEMAAGDTRSTISCKVAPPRGGDRGNGQQQQQDSGNRRNDGNGRNRDRSRSPARDHGNSNDNAPPPTDLQVAAAAAAPEAPAPTTTAAPPAASAATNAAQDDDGWGADETAGANATANESGGPIEDVILEEDDQKDDLPTPAPTLSNDKPNYSDMTFKELQKHCKEKGLKASGKKTDLIQRLEEA